MEELSQQLQIFQGMSAKNDSLSHIKEIVRIYAYSKYLDRNIRWLLFILAEYLMFYGASIDEMVDVSIAGLQWFVLIPRLNHMGSHRPSDSRSKPYLHREIEIYKKILMRNITGAAN